MKLNKLVLNRPSTFLDVIYGCDKKFRADPKFLFYFIAHPFNLTIMDITFMVLDMGRTKLMVLMSLTRYV